MSVDELIKELQKLPGNWPTFGCLRLLHEAIILARGGILTTNTIMVKFNVSKATAKRDMEALQDQLPVERIEGVMRLYKGSEQ